MIVHSPKTDAGKEELARRVATVHAESVIAKINRLNCPTKQKLELVDAVVNGIKSERKTAKA